MKIRSNHLVTATALTLVAFLFLSNATQVAGVVICVGLDGHVDIESIFDGCCILGAPGDRGDSTELSANDSGCSDCTDVQVKAPPLRSKEFQPLQPDRNAGWPACPLPSGTEIATRTAEGADIDQHWKTLTPITTVVLLT
jgi:hypothetical protein